MNKTLEALTTLTQIMVQANVAAPLISGSIMAIMAIVKGVTGTGPSLAEIADMIEAQTGQNDTLIRDNIAKAEAAVRAVTPEPPA